MKRLDELGVSPAPWTMERYSPESTEDGRDIKDANKQPVGCTYTISEHSIADARLIAAAPDLYVCLRNLIEACGAVGYKDGGTAACYESEHKLYRALWDAEAALYKAGGAE